MEKLIDILKYLFRNYPNPNELSKARVVKMVYLADWKNTIEFGKQMTNIKWIYNHYGPYVDDVIEVLKEDSNFEIISGLNVYNQRKDLIKLVGDVKPNLTKDSQGILDFVITHTSKLYWDDFIKLVYSTYPIIKEKRLTELNLVELSIEYKEVLQRKQAEAND